MDRIAELEKEIELLKEIKRLREEIGRMTPAPQVPPCVPGQPPDYWRTPPWWPEPQVRYGCPSTCDPTAESHIG